MFIKQAFLAAWKCACKVNGATIKVPEKLKFLFISLVHMNLLHKNHNTVSNHLIQMKRMHY
jgi:hypothetical protein